MIREEMGDRRERVNGGKKWKFQLVRVPTTNHVVVLCVVNFAGDLILILS
jgi:hypothetical protein